MDPQLLFSCGNKVNIAINFVCILTWVISAWIRIKVKLKIFMKKSLYKCKLLRGLCVNSIKLTEPSFNPSKS